MRPAMRRLPSMHGRRESGYTRSGTGEKGTGMSSKRHARKSRSYEAIEYQGRARRAWPLLLAVPLCLQALASQPDSPGQSVSPADAVRSQLQAALNTADRGDVDAAQIRVHSVIFDPAFSSLEESAQHAALTLAVQLDLRT